MFLKQTNLSIAPLEWVTFNFSLLQLESYFVGFVPDPDH